MRALFDNAGKRFGSPEFDPTLHDLHEGNSLWLEFRDGNGELVACNAARLIETNSFVDLVRTYRLWYGDKIQFSEPVTIIASSEVPVPDGRIAFDGAMWVRTDCRRRGLSWILARYLRATTFALWDLDWIFGFAFPGISKSRLPVSMYGYPRLEPFVADYHLPGYPRYELCLASMSRAEHSQSAALDQMRMNAWPAVTIGPALARRIRGGRPQLVDDPVLPALPESQYELAG